MVGRPSRHARLLLSLDVAARAIGVGLAGGAAAILITCSIQVSVAPNVTSRPHMITFTVQPVP